MNIILNLKTFYTNFCDKMNRKKGFDFFYNKGVDYFLKKNYSSAVSNFKTAMTKADVKPQVYYNLALVYQNVQDYDEAIALYNKFLETNSYDFDAMYNLALSLYSKSDFDKAIELFLKLVEMKRDAETVTGLAKAYLGAKKNDEFDKFADELLEIPNDGINLFFHAANAIEMQFLIDSDANSIEKAISMYTTITERDSNNDKAYLAISICYAKIGNWDKAIEFCKKALEINSKSFEANNQMGLIYFCKHEIVDSIKYYTNAIKIKPSGNYKIYTNLAYAYESNGEYKKAIKTFNKLLWKFPDYPSRDEIKNHVRILKTLD